MKRVPVFSDLLWKAAIEDFFDAFLAYFFPGFVPETDMSRPFEFLDQELTQLMPDHDEKSRRVDKLVKVWLKSGEDQWFLVHVEAQGYDDPDFARRMFTSFYRILDKYNRPVTTMVIYTNKSFRHQPSSFYLNWMETTLEYRFKTLSLQQVSYDELAKADNPFGVVLQAAWGMTRKNALSEPQLAELKLAILRKLLASGMTKERIARLIYFISNFIPLTKPELNRTFEAAVGAIFPPKAANMGIIEVVHEHWMNEGRQEMQQQMQQQMQEMQREFVIRLIGSGFEDAEVIRLSGTTSEFVQAVRAELHR